MSWGVASTTPAAQWGLNRVHYGSDYSLLQPVAGFRQAARWLQQEPISAGNVLGLEPISADSRFFTGHQQKSSTHICSHACGNDAQLVLFFCCTLYQVHQDADFNASTNRRPLSRTRSRLEAEYVPCGCGQSQILHRSRTEIVLFTSNPTAICNRL